MNLGYPRMKLGILNTDYVSAAFLFSSFHNSIKLHCNRLSV
jgi:hypothetical protein